MDNWSFGFTMTVVGVAGTFLTIGALILGMAILKRIFPLKQEHQNTQK
ncbi:MAG: OadG-related small transporter subunit [Deltaproteobacteria bacterium]|nr:OadG-related small transporter subunit [Deltaproteobacteria bacterium]